MNRFTTLESQNRLSITAITTKILFQYEAHVPKRNLCFGVTLYCNLKINEWFKNIWPNSKSGKKKLSEADPVRIRVGRHAVARQEGPGELRRRPKDKGREKAHQEGALAEDLRGPQASKCWYIRMLIFLQF